MRVVIADDSVLLREGLAQVLTEDGFDVVAQAANAESCDTRCGASTDIGIVCEYVPGTPVAGGS